MIWRCQFKTLAERQVFLVDKNQIPLLTLVTIPQKGAFMPLVRIENFPLFREEGASENWQHQFAHAIRQAAVSADVPRVVRTGITVTFGGQQILKDDKTLMILVIGLFDTEDRPKKLRDRLARHLGKASKHFLPDDWKIEVLVYRFNTDSDSYYESEPVTAGYADPDVDSVSSEEVIDGLDAKVTGPGTPPHLL
jgi:hypothetical protein